VTALDATHDPALRSWVASANEPGTDFPIQNLPMGIVRERGRQGGARVGVAIGGHVLDLAAAVRAGLFEGDALAAAVATLGPTLNPWMALSPALRRTLRRGISAILREGSRAEAAHRARPLLLPLDDVEPQLPAAIGDYTDFYASVHHATNVGSMFRPDNPLLPNYKWVPIGYHGRASSIVVSGTPVRRPVGQVQERPEAPPVVKPSARLDYELELGAFVGPGNALGAPIPLGQAGNHVAGFCLVNDWSARDVQAWEYQPLGPFLAKNFATSISPWVVTADALVPYRTALPPRAPGDPAPLGYLHDPADAALGALDVTLEAWLSSRAMRERGMGPVRLSRSSTRDLYWTTGQMVAHHTMNGCNLRPGDLLASGTVSGPERGARGCLLELTWRGSEPITLPTGEQRRFLEDGDEVTLRGRCAREGFATIGFGDCRGVIEPAG